MKISKEKCVGCANCVPICSVGAIYIGEDGLSEINTEACVECYNCYRSMSFEHLAPGLTRTGRKMLKKVSLRFQPPPDLSHRGHRAGGAELAADRAAGLQRPHGHP